MTAAPNPPFSAGSVPFRWSLAPAEEVSNFLSFGDKGNGDFNGEMIVKDTLTENTLVIVPFRAKRENSLCARLKNCPK